jgi:hypothetical protein
MLSKNLGGHRWTCLVKYSGVTYFGMVPRLIEIVLKGLLRKYFPKTSGFYAQSRIIKPLPARKDVTTCYVCGGGQ